MMAQVIQYAPDLQSTANYANEVTYDVGADGVLVPIAFKEYPYSMHRAARHGEKKQRVYYEANGHWWGVAGWGEVDELVEVEGPHA